MTSAARQKMLRETPKHPEKKNTKSKAKNGKSDIFSNTCDSPLQNNYPV
jgi:hypothetical protein